MSLQYSTFTRITSATRGTLSGTDGNVIDGTAAYETDTNKIIVYYDNEWKTFNTSGKRNVSLEGIAFDVDSEPTLTGKINSSDDGTFFFNKSTTVNAFEISRNGNTRYRYGGDPKNKLTDDFNVYTANVISASAISKTTHLATTSDISTLSANDIITNTYLNRTYMPTVELNHGPRSFLLKSHFKPDPKVSYYTDMGNTVSISAVQLPSISSEPFLGGDMAIIGINPSLSSIGIYNDYGHENTITCLNNTGDQKYSDLVTTSLNLSSMGLSALMYHPYNSFDIPAVTTEYGWSFAFWFKVYPDTPHSTDKRQLVGHSSSYYISVSSESDGSNPIIHNSSHFGDYLGTPGDISYDQWHHLIITREPGDPTATDIKTYLDGTLKSTIPSTHASTTHARDIGQQIGTIYNNRLHGALYSATIWRYPLQQNDITNLQTTSVNDMTITETYSALPYRHFDAGESFFKDGPPKLHGTDDGGLFLSDLTLNTGNGTKVSQSGVMVNQINMPIYIEDTPDFS